MQEHLRLTAYSENGDNIMVRNVHKTLPNELSSVRNYLNLLITECLKKELIT